MTIQNLNAVHLHKRSLMPFSTFNRRTFRFVRNSRNFLKMIFQFSSMLMLVIIWYCSVPPENENKRNSGRFIYHMSKRFEFPFHSVYSTVCTCTLYTYSRRISWYGPMTELMNGYFCFVSFFLLFLAVFIQFCLVIFFRFRSSFLIFVSFSFHYSPILLSIWFFFKKPMYHMHDKQMKHCIW